MKGSWRDAPVPEPDLPALRLGENKKTLLVWWVARDIPAYLVQETKMTLSVRALMLGAGLVLASAAFGQKIEETDPSLTFNGAWTPTNDPNASGGTYTISNTVGNTVTFNVTGTNFVLYRKVDSSGGYATITVDGNNFGRITFYAQQPQWQVPAAIDELPDGPHKIVLTVSADSPSGSSGNNVNIDALQNPAPASLGPTQPQLDAITRTNYYRALIGLPPARHHLALGLAANAHAKYLNDTDFVSTGGSPHVETPGASPAFTAAQPGDRDAYFGFTGNAGVEDSNNSADPINFVDGWMDGVYHRAPFTIYALTDAGFGGYPNGSTMDFAPNLLQPAAPNQPTITTFPADGQTDVWLNYNGSDGPNNVTGGNAYGYPLSLMVTYPLNATRGTGPTAPTSGTLVDGNGNRIPVTIADSNTDPQVQGCFLIPNQPLTPSTTYTARMTGADALNNSFDKTWKFTTANLNSVHNVRAVLGRKSYLYTINWDMPGSTVPSQLEYGPTTAYGTIIPGALRPGSQSTFSAQIPGVLTTAGVTHYRVTAKDAQGNVYASPDHTLSVANPIASATVGYISVNPDPDDTGFQFETAGPVASTQIKYGLDTNYGMTSTPTLYGGYTTWFYADLFSLTSGTYHYVITATDLQGNTYTTPDATFIIP